jgi:hypothetical protein
MNMELRKWLYVGMVGSGLMGLRAGAQGQPVPGSAPEGEHQRRFQQRLNTVVATNQPGEPQDPLAYYRKNPELMRRYFPHLAAGDATGGGGVPGAQANNNMNREGAVLESLKFPGGPAENLVEMLKEQLNPPPNIIIAPKLRTMEIPQFELKNVTLSDVFQALNNLSEDKSVQWQLSGSTEPIWVLNPAPGAGNPAGPQPGFSPYLGAARYGVPAAVDPLTGLQVATNNGRVCQILPLGKFLQEYKVEDITTAVKTAWSMMGDDGGAQLKYHTDTKLLIAVGTSGQLSILTQVLSSLETGMDKTGNAEPKSPAVGRKF